MSKSKRNIKQAPSSFRSNDPDLWLSVYQRVEPWAQITCIGEDYRDIMQDVMATALEIGPSDHPNADAWFKLCVRNRFLAIKKRQRKESMDAISTSTGTYQMADVNEVLNGVEFWKRGLFELHYMHGVPVQVICKQVGLNAAIVYNAINEVANIVKDRLS